MTGVAAGVLGSIPLSSPGTGPATLLANGGLIDVAVGVLIALVLALVVDEVRQKKGGKWRP